MASTNITLDDEAYGLLNALKRPGQSYSQVVKDHFRLPADTAGELLDATEKLPPPRGFNAERMEAYLKTRKRRSNRK